jgi:acyl-CoA dehydrogenase
VHPDVRRALLSIKAVNEAGRALTLYTALQGDIAHRSPDEKERKLADDFMGLMTPVVKGVLTDMGFNNTVVAQQMLGGHGYIAEWGMEQFVRDARIPMIYEGANGIQALDLVGRKLPKDGGRALQAFFAEMQGFLNDNKNDEGLKPYLAPVGVSLGHLQQATMWFMANAMAKPDNAGAGATDYMHLFGLVVMGYMWLRIVKAANEKLAAGAGGQEAALRNKLIVGKFFMERMLPETQAHLARISAGAGSVMEMAAEGF